MTRCYRTLSARLLAAALLASTFAATPLLAQAADDVIVPMAIGRTLPPASLRGEIVLTNPPEVTLNGKPDRLAPGSRIRGMNNMLVMPGAAIGQKLIVNYTRESYGLIMDVWVLRDDERAKLWPKTVEDAAKWSFDPLNHTWTK